MLVSSPLGSYDTNKNTNKLRGYQQIAAHRGEQAGVTNAGIYWIILAFSEQTRTAANDDVVPLAGLEPAHLAVPDFESPLILLHSYSQLLTSHLQRLEIMEVLQNTATHYIAALLMQNNWRCLHYAFAREKLCHGND